MLWVVIRIRIFNGTKCIIEAINFFKLINSLEQKKTNRAQMNFFDKK